MPEFALVYQSALLYMRDPAVLRMFATTFRKEGFADKAEALEKRAAFLDTQMRVEET